MPSTGASVSSLIVDSDCKPTQHTPHGSQEWGGSVATPVGGGVATREFVSRPLHKRAVGLNRHEIVLFELLDVLIEHRLTVRA